jgi:hypothetical protein
VAAVREDELDRIRADAREDVVDRGELDHPPMLSHTEDQRMQPMLVRSATLRQLQLSPAPLTPPDGWP